MLMKDGWRERPWFGEGETVADRDPSKGHAPLGAAPGSSKSSVYAGGATSKSGVNMATMGEETFE